MTYKKYIEKGGRKYGPYFYHSRRVENKVISEYYGSQKKINYKNILISISFLLIVVLFIYGFNYIKPYFSGKAIFNINANYEEGLPLGGVLELSLKEGEMVPSSAKLVFNNNGNIFEYPLSRFVSEEDAIEGTFYIQEKTISGEGKGYGIPGKKVVHPNVYFSLDILSSNSSETIAEETPMQEQTIPVEEIVSSEEAPVKEQSAPTEETPMQEQTIPVEEIVSSEEAPVKEQSAPTEETPMQEQTTSVEEKKEEKKEDKSANKNKKEETSAPSLTGNIISTLFRGISNLFLGLTGTGNVVMNIKKTIEGNVSSEAIFGYNLQDAETAELKKSSVYMVDSKGKEKKLDDSSVSLDVVEGKVTVSTDYSEVEEGFGEEYLGNKQKIIYFNLSSLDAIFEQGNLSINLIYEGEEIVSLVTSLEQGEIKTNATLPEVPRINQTALLNETNKTLDTSMEFVSSDVLSEEEKAELFDYFGNVSISTEKSEVFNGRLVRSYKLGDYEVEYSYDYGGEITSELNEQMQKDLMKWLRDILKEISKEKASSESIESLFGNYSI